MLVLAVHRVLRYDGIPQRLSLSLSLAVAGAHEVRTRCDGAMRRRHAACRRKRTVPRPQQRVNVGDHGPAAAPRGRGANDVDTGRPRRHSPLHRVACICRVTAASNGPRRQLLSARVGGAGQDYDDDEFDPTVQPKSGGSYTLWPVVHSELTDYGLKSITPDEVRVAAGCLQRGWERATCTRQGGGVRDADGDAHV